MMQKMRSPNKIPGIIDVMAARPTIVTKIRLARGVHTSGFLYRFVLNMINCQMVIIDATMAPAKNGRWCTIRKSIPIQQNIRPMEVLSPDCENHFM
jgi:hypothetical protein